MVVVFDRLALCNMYMENNFRCQHFPQILRGYERIGGEQVGRALFENERRRQGCLPQCGAGAMSTKGISLPDKIGQSALFVTLTAYTDISLVLTHYARLSTLFNSLDSRVPRKSELREASLRNDSASGRLFMRHVYAFIRYTFGINPMSKTKLRFRGLFGDGKAYFGTVE
ncbi:hypothetical protein JG688_00012080 [Phytophthora aleatoria]|uniref:Uncharacterized protein n=1 Tax=Phytophthora aleatoria TaxID=2496075 RepID=A0A8J5IBG2_9STRA|nr:hypothetical protein JG688_00012080 [Phytophthora aleatoria]